MKTLLQWISVCGASLALTVLPVRAAAQTTPTPQGTFVADTAVPTIISPSVQGSEYFVLNQDLSLLTHSSVDSSLNGTCTASSGFLATSTTPRTFLNDTQNAYFTAASSTGANSAVSGFSFINTGRCQPITGPSIAGGTPAYTFSSNDTFHARYYVLSAFNGSSPDTLTVEVNLNSALSGGNDVSQLVTVPLDTGAQYTSLVTDTTAGASGISLTAITELKTATSPGNLWIYNRSSGAAYKILGPGGVPLPAVGSFIIPAPTNGGGGLLVLINQGNLTATNLSNPPQDTTPFTIIDLGQLIQTFSIQTTGGTVTLPFVTQIAATTPYFAMLGAAYNPVSRLVYAVVGGGSLTGVTGSVISYDPFNPGSPNETVVGDVSNVPFSYGAYPQLALSAASGTLQILTANPTGLYSVGILGTGNLAVAVTGSVFPDTNFKPTYIAANPLLGESYIASASGQVDILKNAATKPLATFTLNGPDIATTTQTYSLQATALTPIIDTALRAAPVTITATPPSPGKPFTVAAGTFGSFGLNPSNISITFPALGVYTLVASIPATATFPAFTSNPVNVTVASNFIAGVYPTTLAITAPSNSTTTAVNVLVNLNGSTYAPTGHIDVKDGTGKVVGTTYFNGGALVQPTTVAVTLAQGPNTLTATYSGDAQNAATTSPALQVSVGTTVTPTLALTLPGSAFVGNPVSGNVTFRSTTTTVPTGVVTIDGQLNGSLNLITLTTVTAAQAFTGTGANFSFNAPAAGGYQVTASYPGDTNYASALSAPQSFTTNPIPVNSTTVITGSSTQSPNVPFNVTVKLTSATTQATPTGNVLVTAVLNSTGASTTLSTIPASQAFVSGGYAAQVVIATAGSYTVTANYSGDANFNGSSNSIAVTVGTTAKVTPTLGLSAPGTQNTGTTANATIVFTSTSTTAPTGTIAIYATATGSTTQIPLTTVTAASAVGGTVYTFTEPAAGSYNLCATYAGDTAYNSAVSNCAAITVNPANTVITSLALTAPTTVTAGSTFNVVIALTGGTTISTAPTGNVILTSTGGTTTTTVATISAAQAFAKGGFTVPLSLSAANQYMLNATYAGDTNYAASANQAFVTVTPAQTPTTLGISGPSSLSVGVPVTVTAMLKATGPPNAPITGNVTLMATGYGGTVNSYSLGTVSAASALASGGAQVTVFIPATGMYTLAAVYAGDANYQASSASLIVTVNKIPTTATVSPSVSLTTVGKLTGVNFQLNVPAASSATPPTGSFVLTETYGSSTTTLATVTAAQALTGSGANFTPTAPGAYTLTVSYAGDANYQPSTSSATVTVSSLPIPEVILVGLTQGLVGTPLTFQVTIADAGTGKPIAATGTLTISSTLAGATGPSLTVNAPTGNSTVTLTFPSIGTYTVSATYSGDSTYGGPATAVPARIQIYTPATLPTFTLLPKDPNLNVNGTAVQITPSTPGLATLLLTPVNGYSGDVVITTTAVSTSAASLANLGTQDGSLTTTILDAKGIQIGFDMAKITVLPPTTAFSIQFPYVQAAELRQMNSRGGPLFCILWGVAVLAGLRKRKSFRRIAPLLCVPIVIVLAAAFVSGCAVSGVTYVVTVKATDSQSGITQTASFLATFAKQ